MAAAAKQDVKVKPPEDEAVREVQAFLAARKEIEPANAWTLNAGATNAAQINFAAPASLSNSYNAGDVLRQAKGAK